MPGPPGARVSLAWDAALEHAENTPGAGLGVAAAGIRRGNQTGGERLEMAADFGRSAGGPPPFCALREQGGCARHSVLSRREHWPSPEVCSLAGAQMQVRGGLVLDMKSMNRVLAVTDDHIEVEAGAGWDVV